MHVLIVGAERPSAVDAGAFHVDLAPSGLEAFARLAERRAHVVVVRHGVPEGDRRLFLARVRDEWPTVVRLQERALDDPNPVKEEVGLAHRVIPSDLDPPRFEAALLDAALLRSRVDPWRTASLVQGFGGLPSAPAAWTELSRHLAHPLSASVPRVVSIVERDVALTALVLRQVNSALLARGQQVTSVHDAVVRLGFQMLQQLVLGVETTRLFAKATDAGVGVESLSDEGLERGLLAASLVTQRADRSAAFVAGMMLEVGQLLAACYLPAEVRAIRALATRRRWNLHEAEAVVWGVTHADIGAHLLESWNLPGAAVVACGAHHEPPERGGLVEPATAARVARCAVPSRDRLDGMREVAGWDDLIEAAVAAPRRPVDVA